MSNNLKDQNDLTKLDIARIELDLAIELRKVLGKVANKHKISIFTEHSTDGFSILINENTRFTPNDLMANVDKLNGCLPSSFKGKRK